jgi:hypothetical protein
VILNLHFQVTADYIVDECYDCLKCLVGTKMLEQFQVITTKVLLPYLNQLESNLTLLLIAYSFWKEDFQFD